MAMFAEVACKEVPQKSEPAVKYNKCVVAFAVQVDKGNNTKARFDKKIVAAISFIQTYIDQHAAFLPIKGLDPNNHPIKEKAVLPEFQLVLCSYFEISYQRAFDSMTQKRGTSIKGSALMVFFLDPQKCLYNAAGDLRNMGCTIFYKQCQEVGMIARQILLGAPNTIEEDVTKQTIDKELKLVEQKLLSENNKYKLSKNQRFKWLNYAVLQEFPAGMPWEGAEEKKKKQGTNNARLVYILYVHEPDYKRMKMLITYAKDWKVGHKHWGTPQHSP
jgi:hypothetical protein